MITDDMLIPAELLIPVEPMPKDWLDPIMQWVRKYLDSYHDYIEKHNASS